MYLNYTSPADLSRVPKGRWGWGWRGKGFQADLGDPV